MRLLGLSFSNRWRVAAQRPVCARNPRNSQPVAPWQGRLLAHAWLRDTRAALACRFYSHHRRFFIFDLGVCSTQLDQPERGFSFRTDGPLDMRMSKSGDSAADVVMQADERMLAQILWNYGEEKASRRIARAIVSARRDGPITTTSQLAAVIHAVMPAKRPGQIDPATRSFQALRIYINRELDELTDGLAAVEAMLEPGGILAVVSFHSLEDRIVKRFLTARSQAAARPSRHMPDIDGPASTFELLGRKAVVPSVGEQAENTRARSAKLRVACRTTAPAIAAIDDTPHRQGRS